MLLNFLPSRAAHPLADVGELKRLIGGLPLDNAFDALDQVSAWLESLQQTDGLALGRFFDVLHQIDEAAQPHLQRLAREYLNSSRVSKNEEGRLWTSNHGYWVQVANLYAQCIERFISRPNDKGSAALKASLPLVSARLVAALAAQLKWLAYRYSPAKPELWADLGRAYLVADALGYAEIPLRLYADRSTESSVRQQYLHALVREASSIDCLTPLEIELADRVSEYFLPGFVFSAESRSDSVYWVDAARGFPPIRLARQPLEISASMRFFSPGTAAQTLDELIAALGRGEMPDGLNLGRAAAPKQLLPVLRHLARYWAAHPPLREHPRHPVKNRCAVRHGFKDCHAALAGGYGVPGDSAAAEEVEAESWLVENVSFGGFGAEVDCARSDWPKLGALLCLQPDGGQNWVLAVVRRYGRRSETQARVGIQSLSRQATSIELHVHNARARALAVSGFPCIWLGESGAAGEARIALPANRFDLQQELVFSHDHQRTVLTPIVLEESGSDYQIGRYYERIDG
jgi:hypothetical protein